MSPGVPSKLEALEPEPSRIVLAGSSGGGYGTILASVLVRIACPDVPIDVVSDSGTGVARRELEPEFVDDRIEGEAHATLLGDVSARKWDSRAQ